jgi:hypothetical protein
MEILALFGGYCLLKKLFGSKERVEKEGGAYSSYESVYNAGGYGYVSKDDEDSTPAEGLSSTAHPKNINIAGKEKR